MRIISLSLERDNNFIRNTAFIRLFRSREQREKKEGAVPKADNIKNK
jgi:hypothetical protein